jgi:cation transport protein ChaC
MLALDHGGSCEGVAYRLPAETATANLAELSRREIIFLPHPFPPRWVDVETETGSLRAVTFVMDQTHRSYVGGLSPDQVADALASAVGQHGSMAQYLHSTVVHLEEIGIHDDYLWLLQDLVAERIERDAANP